MITNPIKMKKLKINLEFDGVKIKNVPVRNYNADTLYGTASSVSNLVSKYLKRKYPEHKKNIYVRSSSFSMGDAVDVYLGGDFTDDQVDQIQQTLLPLELGRFDGMQDYYDHKEKSERFTTVIDGKEVELYTKYLHISNKLPWDKEYKN